MQAALLGLEAPIRLGVFLGLFSIMVLWEGLAPRRRPSMPRLVRWPNALTLTVLNTVALRLTMPVLAVEAAVQAQMRGWGLLTVLEAPLWLALPLAVVVLDLAIYAQHIVFHRVPLLWRLHRVHHADPDFDVTTALRFHPVEIVLSMLFKLAIVAVLGAPAVAVLLFELLLNGSAMFNHGNVRLPGGLDHWLRWVIVTPDMHRVHHSVRPAETNSNYGFALPWWDRLFGTYTPQPLGGHIGMTIGLEDARSWRDLWLDRLLLLPLRNTRGG